MPISAPRTPTPAPPSRRDPPPHRPGRGRHAPPRWYGFTPPERYSFRPPLTPGGVGAGRWRLHWRRRRVAHRRDGWRHRLRGQSAIHPGDLSAQLPVGPRSPAGSGEPRVAGPGLGRWGRTPIFEQSRAVDHRPGLHHLRDLRWTLRIFGCQGRGRLRVGDRGTREFLNVWGNCG